jgi:CDP-paratose 2-epimerase
MVLVTGGAGFIGANLVHRLMRDGDRVRIYDNLSREGTAKNLDWLHSCFGSSLDVEIADIRNANALRSALQGIDFVYHFASQVAVTSSLKDPVHDFSVNARATVLLLDELRALQNPPGLLFTSTNKVYGGLADCGLHALRDRYEPDDSSVASRGISEKQPLDFHSPYGCSKGAADQYVLDFARSYGLRAAVFRMSCIYGPHQFGNEDQGWVAHFALRAMRREPITIYGDGKQVRDILFIDDLLEAMLAARARIHEITGQAFNIGGGPENTISLVELLAHLRRLCGHPLETVFSGWRTGDQRYYVSDFSRFQQATGWAPRVSVPDGVTRLYDWLREEAQVGEALFREAG